MAQLLSRPTWLSLRRTSRERVRSDFATVASHQLRTPISIIRWALDMVISGRCGRMTVKQHEYLERAYQQNAFMARIVGDLLRISRIEEGKIGAALGWVNLAAVVRKVVRGETLLAKAYNCAVRAETPRRLPRVWSDELKLQEVVQILVDNAIRYGRREGQVLVRLRASPAHVELSVRDRGIGIPTRQQKYIFQKFFRADNAIRSQTEGLGLELSIAKSYVNLLGGQITFRSVPRQGTTFTVTLPRRFSRPKPAGAKLPLPGLVSDDLRHVIGYLSDGVLLLDPAFQALELNPAAEQLLGVSGEAAVGRYLGDILQVTELTRSIQRQPRTEVSFVARIRLPGEDHAGAFQFRLLPLRRHDMVEGWLLIVHLVPSHRRSDAAERLRREREFVSVTVHELNGPLGVSKWSLEMLRREMVGPLNGEQRRLLDQVYHNVERLLVLVKDLLNLSRLQEGRFPVNPRPLALSPIVAEVVKGFAPAARSKHIALRLPPRRRWPNALVDPNRITQALGNLVSNAIKYTPPGGRVTVMIERLSSLSLQRLVQRRSLGLENMDAAHGYLVVSVKDTGLGIPLSQQQKLFTKFFRARSVLKSKIEGTGLGLYIARAIVQLHQGDIWCESSGKHGSTFRFSLPVA